MAMPATISTQIELDHAFDESKTRPVVIFKNSTRCSISAHAYQTYRDFVEEASSPDTLFTVIQILDARPVSDALAQRTGIRHESPQILVLKDGQVAWSASHWEISREGIEQALEKGAA
ncbi:MAG: hypothetical protein DHS20C21_22480 [Gemmatimonadota bacterium]|nr:MAG: hypothetical protein DHS20C21_22480 [Gemmatimonadota bacterium]